MQSPLRCGSGQHSACERVAHSERHGSTSRVQRWRALGTTANMMLSNQGPTDCACSWHNLPHRGLPPKSAEPEDTVTVTLGVSDSAKVLEMTSALRVPIEKPWPLRRRVHGTAVAQAAAHRDAAMRAGCSTTAERGGDGQRSVAAHGRAVSSNTTGKVSTAPVCAAQRSCRTTCLVYQPRS